MTRKLFLLVAVLGIGISSHAAKAAIHIQPITLPLGGVTVSTGSPFPFDVDFGTTFGSITNIQWTGTFSGDLLDSGESWFIGSAGQLNNGGLPRSSFILNITSPTVLSQMLDGKHSYSFIMSGGSVHLASLEMRITGEAVPEPSSAIVWSLLALTVGIAAWRQQRKATALGR